MMEIERQRQADFLKKHNEFYENFIKILVSCIERDDIKELSLHCAYLGKCIEQALNLRLMMQQQEGRAAGNA